MIKLPKYYEWLNGYKAPKMLVEALRHFGTLEVPGKGNNSTILKWAEEIGGKVANVYVADEIPWCGLFMAIVAKHSNYEVPKEPLWALNWGTFGTYIKNTEAMLGDVLVFVRKTSTGAKAGHVGMYIGEDEECFHVLGGNQSDQVCITRLKKNRLYAVRRPLFKVGQPTEVKKVYLSAIGSISKNEA